MSEDRDTEQVSSTWLAQLRREYVIYGSECARLQKDLDSTKRMFENAVMTIVTIGEAAGVRGEDQQNGHLEIVEAINKIKGRRAVYKAKATELERELEVWRSGPVCWSCGDSGEVHSLDGEWRGECNCQGAVDARRIAELEADRDRIKTIADNYSELNMDAQAELAATKAQEPVVDEQAAFEDWITRVCPGGDCSSVVDQWLASSDYADLYAAPVSEAKAQEPDCDRSACGDFSPGPCDNPDCSARRDRTVVAPAAKAQGVVMPDVNAAAKALCNRHAMICGVDAGDQWKEYSQDFIADAETVLANARLNAAPVQQVSVPDEREAFEREAVERYGFTRASIYSRRQGLGYSDSSLCMAWIMWQARAMLAAAPAAPAADACKACKGTGRRPIGGRGRIFGLTNRCFECHPLTDEEVYGTGDSHD